MLPVSSLTSRKKHWREPTPQLIRIRFGLTSQCQEELNPRGNGQPSLDGNGQPSTHVGSTTAPSPTWLLGRLVEALPCLLCPQARRMPLPRASHSAFLFSFFFFFVSSTAMITHLNVAGIGSPLLPQDTHTDCWPFHR